MLPYSCVCLLSQLLNASHFSLTTQQLDSTNHRLHQATMANQAPDTPTPAQKPGPNNTPPPTGAPQADQINLKFNDANGSGVEFKLKATTKLGKAMNAFSARMQRDIHQLRFLFEGHRVQPDDTPESVSGRRFT